jgi:hypothetical protein
MAKDEIDLGASAVSGQDGRFALDRSTWQAIQAYTVDMTGALTSELQKTAEFDIPPKQWCTFECLLKS